ncbi:MAG: hypothetical protein PHF64_00210 [Methanoregula sp.]|nr:hypothetical protein [Methanoregula sp.]
MTEQGVSSRPENNDLGLRMRTCERCGVGLGTMPRAEYVKRFVRGKATCPSCHKPAISNGQCKGGAWVSVFDLSKKYVVSDRTLLSMITQKLFTFWESECVGAGLPRYYLRERDVAKQFAVRAT